MVNQEEDAAQKTEAPTPRRLEKAKEEGDVPISRELRSWSVLLALAGFVFFAGGWFLETLGGAFTVFLERPDQISLLSYDDWVITLLSELGLAMGLLFAVMIAILVLTSLAQTGIVWAPKKLQPNPQIINPIRGLKQKLHKNNLVEFLKSLVKLTFLSVTSYFVLRPIIRGLPDRVDKDIRFFPSEALNDMLLLMLFILISYFVIVVVDIVWQRYSYTERLRMTPQEVRDERKDIEGNPEIKRRIARLRAERARTILTQAMRRADVVLTNPTHYSVALRYDQQEDQAPVVVAKGIDFIALRIRTLAQQNGVPLYENPALARLLYDTVEVEQEVDPSQYEAVAEVIRYVWSLKNANA